MNLLIFLMGIALGMFFILGLIWIKQFHWEQKLKNRKTYSLRDKHPRIIKTNIEN